MSPTEELFAREDIAYHEWWSPRRDRLDAVSTENTLDSLCRSAFRSGAAFGDKRARLQLEGVLRRASLFMAQGFDSREALALKAALSDAGFPPPTAEEYAIMRGQEDFDPADWDAVPNEVQGQ